MLILDKKMENLDLSIVSPVYLSEDCIDELVDRVNKALFEKVNSFEIILVDDGSPDFSWQKIKENTKKYKHVVGLKLSRNFGQHHAIAAGLGIARGAYVVVMDCDLQNPPEEILTLYDAAARGNEIVLSRRKSRDDSFVSHSGSKLYHACMSFLIGRKIDPEIGSFCIMSNFVVSQYLRFTEHFRTLVDIIYYLGFSPLIIDLPNPKREKGKSSYSFSKKFYMAVNELINHTTRIIYLCVGFSFCLVLVSVLSLFLIFITSFFGGVGVPGWASLISILIFFGGFLGAMLGLIGLYVAKVYVEVRNRPLFIIQEKLNQ